ncbi:hypothetical protein ACFQE1_21550, partial [Halobium palmae]
STGSEGVLHGARTKLLQDRDGQIMESHSVSSGLDYAGVGPELSHLVDEGRVRAVNVDDDAALAAFHRLSQEEGIIPALETAHAFGYLHRVAGSVDPATRASSGRSPRDEEPDDLGEVVIVAVSGRGDKDLETVLEETEGRNVENAPDLSVLSGGLGGAHGGESGGYDGGPEGSREAGATGG